VQTTDNKLFIHPVFLSVCLQEIFPPELKEMAYVTAEAHNKTEIKSMEKIIFAVCSI
jgi:hypothetical protein